VIERRGGIHRILMIFTGLYIFDFGYTVSFITLDNLNIVKYIDLAHFLFIPYIGLHGYIIFRLLILPPIILMAVKWYDGSREAQPIKNLMLGLTAYYSVIVANNIAQLSTALISGAQL
jgi:hypothetical protein